jgi:Spy/CpxP family protein refolding chaperone
MKSKHIVTMLAVLGLLVSGAALAAETVKQPAPEVKKDVVRVEADDDDSGPGAFAWVGDDDLDSDEFIGDDDGPGGDDHRIVIRRQMGPGMRRGGPMHREMRHRMMGAFARLDLTDAQKKQLAEVHEKQQRKAIQSRADLDVARLDMRKAMRAETPNAASINAQIDKISKLRADAQKSRVAAFLEARALLTPEQQKQLREGPMGGPGKKMMYHGAPPPGGGGDSD